MKKSFTLTACALSAMMLNAQNIVINLNDGTQTTYTNKEVARIEFQPAAEATQLHYATTDMTWAEFFAGELNQSAQALADDGLDAVTSATTQKSGRFSACTASEAGNQLLGVKAVSVAVPDDLYQQMSEEDKGRYNWTDSVMAEYKTLRADGSFSSYNSVPTQVEGVTVALNSGAGFNWGNYGLSLSGTLTRDSIPVANLQGAVITTSQGVRYAFVPLYNVWLNTTEMAFCVKDFTEPHGNTPAYGHTAGLQGKTITNITYLMKDRNNLSVDCSVYVKRQTKATAAADGVSPAGIDPVAAIVMTDVPSDADYQIMAVKKGSGKKAATLAADAYTYADGILSLHGYYGADTLYTVLFSSDKYVNIAATFTLSADGTASTLQQKMTGTYVELFGTDGCGNSKWDSLWIAECAKCVGEEQAAATAAMLKRSMTGTLHGAEAVAKYGENPTAGSDLQFDCSFLGVSKFNFDGRRITALDAEGQTIASHCYHKTGVEATYGWQIYKSDDDNQDEYTYFFLLPDNPIDTYHIEFRYGSNPAELPFFFSGAYAYWMAAGVLENDDAQCEAAIKLFVSENLGGE